jgi:hypothetical protein
MAGIEGDNSTEARISPTKALQLVMAEGLSGHDAADRLNTAARTNKCRLWCNGKAVPVTYIVTSLALVARTEPDDRWRADVVSTRHLAWKEPADSYVFEFDAEEVKALLLLPSPSPSPPSPPQPSPSPPSMAQETTPKIPPSPAPQPGKRMTLARWIVGAIKEHRRQEDEKDADYAERLRRHAPREWAKKSIQNALIDLAHENRSPKKK